MSFVAPLGFLALIGIPVLIFIYIIKNRYTEQTVSSTYLWTLSERFLKRRIPINRITGILSLLLQILAVILIAIILAHPIFTIPNAAEAYCFILDGSGSMNMVQDGKTRFDVGKEKIVDMINRSMLGSTYTFICAGESTATIFRNDTDKERVVALVNDSSASYTAATMTDALGAAQRYFSEFPYVKTYLITDKDYENTENVEVINVSSAVENYALSEVRQNEDSSITGKVTSYQSDANGLKVSLYLDGAEKPFETKEVSVKKLAGVEFEFDCSGVNFASARVAIEQIDALMLDNEAIIYKVANQNMAKTLLVSDNRFFIETLLNRSGIYADKSESGSDESQMEYLLDVMPTKAYDEEEDKSKFRGYGLYIFDSYTPEVMPEEGAVWFVNPTDNIKDSNFSFVETVTAENPAEYSDSPNSVISTQLTGVERSLDFHPRDYVKLSLNGRFTTLASCEGNPVIFTGAGANGNREVVFAFDLRSAGDLMMSPNIVMLFSNMISYSFPQVVANTSFVSGDTLQVNMIADCRSISIESPLGNISYPDTSSAISEYVLEEVGTYKINLFMKDESVRTVSVYSSLPEEERQPISAGGTFRLQGTPRESNLAGIIDNLLIVFIILAVIAVADYGVYCYEQYQLR